MGALATQGFVMERGKHRGKHIRTVPTRYLRWMVRERARGFSWAAIELEKRSENASGDGQQVVEHQKKDAAPLAMEKIHA